MCHSPGRVLALSSEPGCLGVAGDVRFASSLQKEERCVTEVGMGGGGQEHGAEDFCPLTTF